MWSQWWKTPDSIFTFKLTVNPRGSHNFATCRYVTLHNFHQEQKWPRTIFCLICCSMDLLLGFMWKFDVLLNMIYSEIFFKNRKFSSTTTTLICPSFSLILCYYYFYMKLILPQYNCQFCVHTAHMLNTHICLCTIQRCRLFQDTWSFWISAASTWPVVSSHHLKDTVNPAAEIMRTV